MLIAGCDYSTHNIDVIFLDLDTNKAEWRRWELTGQDAFDRTRTIRETMPPRTWWHDQGIVALGLEHPAGKHGTGTLMRVQGAILACIPTSLLVQPWAPAAWRKAVGLKGNASKEDVYTWAIRRINEQPNAWPLAVPHDATDAYCIARATSSRIREGEPA